VHPVLKAAIDRPRMPRPYGSGHEDNLFGRSWGIVPVDAFMKQHSRVEHANDNYSRRDYRAE
jgi:hypothetical protein